MCDPELFGNGFEIHMECGIAILAFQFNWLCPFEEVLHSSTHILHISYALPSSAMLSCALTLILAKALTQTPTIMLTLTFLLVFYCSWQANSINFVQSRVSKNLNMHLKLINTKTFWLHSLKK